MAATYADALTVRKPDYDVDPLIVRRWSPRAMSGEALTDDELMTLFDAARWAPSSYNEQEWRFLYATRAGGHWPAFFELLLEGNRAWCDRAGVLVVVTAAMHFTRTGKPNPVHAFDTGAAFQNLALQGAKMGLVVHGMAGFDYERARATLNVPETHAVLAMIAIGRPGDAADLPEPLRALEQPSLRKPIREIAREGRFAF